MIPKPGDLDDKAKNYFVKYKVHLHFFVSCFYQKGVMSLAKNIDFGPFVVT